MKIKESNELSLKHVICNYLRDCINVCNTIFVDKLSM